MFIGIEFTMMQKLNNNNNKLIPTYLKQLIGGKVGYTNRIYVIWY